jgi:hypothetical protein
MTTTMRIINKMCPGKTIIVQNPNHIPFIGSSIDMGYVPAPKVIAVLFSYPTVNETNIDVVVD